MAQLKAMILGGLFTLVFCLAITLGVLLLSAWQPVRVDASSRPVITAVDGTHADFQGVKALPQRDITQQGLAPAALN